MLMIRIPPNPVWGNSANINPVWGNSANINCFDFIVCFLVEGYCCIGQRSEKMSVCVRICVYLRVCVYKCLSLCACVCVYIITLIEHS